MKTADLNPEEAKKGGLIGGFGPSAAPGTPFCPECAVETVHFGPRTASPKPPKPWELMPPMRHAVELVRLYAERDATVGQMRLDGRFCCYTLEPPQSGGRHPAILPGRYRLSMALSTRFHRMMIRLEDRNGRSGILIHAGNSAADTHGCILLGRSYSLLRNSGLPTCIRDSADACRNFYRRVVPWFAQKTVKSIDIKKLCCQ